MNISAHISYDEAVRSSKAEELEIENKPDYEQLENMRMLAQHGFEPLRKFVGGPIKINSFFRNPEVNQKVGGSKTSQHQCINDSAAIDVDDVYKYKTNAEMFHWIKDNLDFDQLIWEYGDEDNPAWVHFSMKKEGNRKIVLRATKENGYTKF